MGKEDTRDKILSVANKLFSKFGFHKTSMDEIAKIARKAKGSLYYHFSSKEELFAQIVSVEITMLKYELTTIVTDTTLSASDKLKNYLIKRMAVLNNASNYHETLKADFYEHFDFVDALREDLDVWEKDKLKTILLEGVKNKEFAEIKDINVVLDMFVMFLKGFEIPFFIQNHYKNYSPYFNDLLNILIKGFK